jgi:F-box/leucine-rich repeat protein 2/20
MFWCDEITFLGLATALRERPTLRSLSFSSTGVEEVFPTSQHVDSLVSLKGLTCLELHCLIISDELLYSIAREGLPLMRFVLLCTGYSYAGIICLLSKCQRIQHLDLRYTDFLNDQHVVEFSSFLVDLVSIDLSYCGQLTKRALFVLARKCPPFDLKELLWAFETITGILSWCHKEGSKTCVRKLQTTERD